MKTWQHAANEWADAATNGLQWVRNIRDGISTPEEAIAALQSDIAHAQSEQPELSEVTPNVELTGRGAPASNEVTPHVPRSG